MNTGGAGIVIQRDTLLTEAMANMTMQYQLNEVFMRDWNSNYTRSLYCERINFDEEL